jgi:hypothetical protein
MQTHNPRQRRSAVSTVSPVLSLDLTDDESPRVFLSRILHTIIKQKMPM